MWTGLRMAEFSCADSVHTAFHVIGGIGYGSGSVERSLHDPVGLHVRTEHERMLTNARKSFARVERLGFRVVLPDAEPDAPCAGGTRACEPLVQQLFADA